MEGVSNTMIEVVGECVMYWIGEWWQGNKDLLYGELIDRFRSSPIPPHEQLDTVHMLISITDLFVT